MPSSFPEYRVISIGTFAAHPLWNEKTPVRTGHATTTLISIGDDLHILVDPGLPAPALVARMSERTQVRPEQVTHVFLTSLEQDRRRGLRAFEHAKWLTHEPEREAALAGYTGTRDEAREAGDHELVKLAEQEIAIVERCEIAPDSLAPNVDLFPLPGVTAGTCGLLISLPGSTVLVCGDAVASVEHLEQAKVLPDCVSISQAQDSFKEAVEIADVLILGRDNMVLNPVRRM